MTSKLNSRRIEVAGLAFEEEFERGPDELLRGNGPEL
jgi:hypothetical protein